MVLINVDIHTNEGEIIMKYKCYFKILNKCDFGNGNVYQDYSATIIDTHDKYHDLSLVSGFCESVLRTKNNLICQILENINDVLLEKEIIYTYCDEYCEVYIYKDKTFIVDGVSYKTFDIENPPGDCINDCNCIETIEFRKIIEWWKSKIDSLEK